MRAGAHDGLESTDEDTAFSLRSVVDRSCHAALARIGRMSDAIIFTIAEHGAQPSSVSVAVRQVVEEVQLDVSLLMQELMESFPVEAASSSGSHSLAQPPNASTATPAEWLRCVAGLKQRLVELSVRLADNETRNKMEAARHARKETMFRYVKEQLQHEIVMLRAERGTQADQFGAFATLDMLLVLGDSTDAKEVALKVQELVAMLADKDARNAVAEGGMLAATTATAKAKRELDGAKRQMKALGDRFVAETTKLKLAVLAAEKINQALSAEISNYQRQIDVAKDQATAERNRANAREAERDAIEIQLIRLKQDQHTEKEHLYVTCATMAMQLQVDSLRGRKKWTVEPDQKFIDTAKLISGSAKAPFTDRQTLEQLVAVAWPPDDPKLVATHLAQRQRIDHLLQEVELWRETAGTLARAKDCEQVLIAELSEDVRRLSIHLSEKGLPLPPLQTVRERAMDVPSELSGESALRHVLTAVRTEAAIETRRLRLVASKLKQLVKKLAADAPVTSQSGALDPSMRFDDVSESDDDEHSGESKNGRELGELARMVNRVDRRIGALRGTSITLSSEVRSLRECAVTNNAGMFDERRLWQEAWEQLLAELPPPIGSKLNVGVLAGLKNRAVQDVLQKAIRDSTAALQREAEACRASIAQAERMAFEAEFAEKSAAMLAREQAAAAQVQRMTLELRDTQAAAAASEAKVSKLAAQLATLQQQSGSKGKPSTAGTAPSAGGTKGPAASTSTAKLPKAQGADGTQKPPKDASPTPPRPRPRAPGVEASVDTSDLPPPPNPARRANLDAGTQTAPSAGSVVDVATVTELSCHASQELALRTVGLLGTMATQTDPLPAAAQTIVMGTQTHPADVVDASKTIAALPTTFGDNDLSSAIAALEAQFAEDRMEVKQTFAHRMPSKLPAARRIYCPSCAASAAVESWQPCVVATIATQTDFAAPGPVAQVDTCVETSLRLGSSRRQPSFMARSAQYTGTDDLMAATMDGIMALDDVPPPGLGSWESRPPSAAAVPKVLPKTQRRDDLPPQSPTCTKRVGSGDRHGSSLRRTSADAIRRLSDAVAPLVDAVAQTVDTLVDEHELIEFASRVKDLETLLETMTQRAEVADRALRKAQALQRRLQAAGTPAPNPAPPIPDADTTTPAPTRKDLTFKEQMLARSLSPPHPMFRHSLAAALMPHTGTPAAPKPSAALTPTPSRAGILSIGNGIATPAELLAAKSHVVLPKLQALNQRRLASRGFMQ